MGKHFFDYDDGNFAHTISDNMTIDSGGDLLMRMGDSCASLLFAQGVSLKEIQAWLGHSTIGTTANIYTHLDENNKLSSANAIIAILPEM